MKYLDAMLDLAEKELEVYSKNGKFRSRDEIDTAYKLVDIVKDVYCIWNYEDGGSEYSGADDPYSRRAYRSYESRKRDSMGRYARDGREEYLEQLRSMAADAPDERTRNNLERMAREIERA